VTFIHARVAETSNGLQGRDNSVCYSWSTCLCWIELLVCMWLLARGGVLGVQFYSMHACYESVRKTIDAPYVCTSAHKQGVDWWLSHDHKMTLYSAAYNRAYWTAALNRIRWHKIHALNLNSLSPSTISADTIGRPTFKSPSVYVSIYHLGRFSAIAALPIRMRLGLVLVFGLDLWLGYLYWHWHWHCI